MTGRFTNIPLVASSFNCSSSLICGSLSFNCISLYSIPLVLKNDDLLSYEWVESTQGPPRKYYKLTEQGEVFLGELEISWKELNDTVNHIANR